MKQFKRRHVTLIEMMIVMFLIALITGIIAYNYRGSLDEGKAFKTQAGIAKLESILNLQVADNPDALEHIETDWKVLISNSPLVQNKDALFKDGWGQEYKVSVENNNIRVHSDKYEEYKRTTKTLFNDKK